MRAVLLFAALFVVPFHTHAADGAALYKAKCALCHQAQGQGVDGRYPPLTGLEGWLATPLGREYLSRVVVNGLYGPITVVGQHYNALMWTFKGRLKDPQLVAVLRYVAESINTAPEGYQAFDSGAISAARAASGSDKDMLALRARLPPR